MGNLFHPTDGPSPPLSRLTGQGDITGNSMSGQLVAKRRLINWSSEDWWSTGRRLCCRSTPPRVGQLVLTRRARVDFGPENKVVNWSSTPRTGQMVQAPPVRSPNVINCSDQWILTRRSSAAQFFFPRREPETCTPLPVDNLINWSTNPVRTIWSTGPQTQPEEILFSLPVLALVHLNPPNLGFRLCPRRPIFNGGVKQERVTWAYTQ